jgi:glucose-6-phosphate 1-dehydrogenase
MQNHLLQVLSLIAMERPVSLSPEDIRDEKVKVLKAIPPIVKENVLLGQYDKSEDGTKPAYVDDKTVNPDSQCATFAALQLEINNERWEGVPFILKAGKALNEGKVEVRIQFKSPARGLFCDIARNELVLRVQPKEAIYMKMNAKYPGLSTRAVITDLDLTYNRRFSELAIPEAYESLILDCLKGDHSNFVRDDELDVSWKIFTPILHSIDRKELPVAKYPYGSRGPSSVDPWLKKRGYTRESEQAYTWPVTKGNL